MGFDLDIIIADYLASVDGQPPVRWRERRRDWEQDVLHVTDLNACPRQVALRLKGANEEPRAPQESRKFALANFQHELIYLALDWAGILIDAEVPVPLPDGWKGTADMVLNDMFDSTEEDPSRCIVADSKNPVAGAQKYASTYPKPEDVRQVSVYSLFLGEIYHALRDESEGQVFYLPLGGASRWVPTRFTLHPENDLRQRMAHLEAVRDNLPNLPDPLPLSISWWNRRAYTRKDGGVTVSGELYYSVDWRCRYCRYECPNRELSERGQRLCRVSSSSPTEFTSLGRRMTEEIAAFLLEDLQE